jgi:hypothetical protein
MGLLKNRLTKEKSTSLDVENPYSSSYDVFFNKNKLHLLMNLSY